MNIINVGGNAICVFGLKMGVAGVAVPSLVSRAVAGFCLYFLLKNPDNLIYLNKERFRFDWNVIRRILHIGIPSGIENGIFQLGRVIVVSIIAGFGTVQIAANGVANSLDSMGCIVGQGMNLAMITVIGQCVGAGDLDQVKYYTKKLLLITYASTAVINSLILLFLHPILEEGFKIAVPMDRCICQRVWIFQRSHVHLPTLGDEPALKIAKSII